MKKVLSNECISKAKFKLLVNPIEQCASCFEQAKADKKSQCDKNPITGKAGPSYVWGTRSSMLDWVLNAGLSCTEGFGIYMIGILGSLY